MNFYPVNFVKLTDRKRCIRANGAICTGGLNIDRFSMKIGIIMIVGEIKDSSGELNPAYRRKKMQLDVGNEPYLSQQFAPCLFIFSVKLQAKFPMLL